MTDQRITRSGIEEFLSRSKDPTELYQGRDATKERIREKLQEILAEKNMGNVNFEIEQVAELEIDPHSGKFRLVVRESVGESDGLRN